MLLGWRCLSLWRRLRLFLLLNQLYLPCKKLRFPRLTDALHTPLCEDVLYLVRVFEFLARHSREDTLVSSLLKALVCWLYQVELNLLRLRRLKFAHVNYWTVRVVPQNFPIFNLILSQEVAVWSLWDLVYWPFTLHWADRVTTLEWLHTWLKLLLFDRAHHWLNPVL